MNKRQRLVHLLTWLAMPMLLVLLGALVLGARSTPPASDERAPRAEAHP